MKFGMGSTTELTPKCQGQSTKKDMRTSKHIIYKHIISPTFNCVTPDSVLLASLARQLIKDMHTKNYY